MTAPGRSDQIGFGPFVLDPGSRQLSRSGRIIHLTPKAFDLIAMLVEHRPNAVSKSALHERLWPRTFVADANLAGLVAEARTALGDSARRPAFIRTVHAFGYAFSGPARVMTSPIAVDVSTACWLTSRTRHFALHEGESVIGRDPQHAVWLDATSVSRRHARCIVTSGRAQLEDLESKNGTWVDTTRLRAPRALEDGDKVRFGSIVLTFRTQIALSTETGSRTRG